MGPRLSLLAATRGAVGQVLTTGQPGPQEQTNKGGDFSDVRDPEHTHFHRSPSRKRRERLLEAAATLSVLFIKHFHLQKKPLSLQPATAPSKLSPHWPLNGLSETWPPRPPG